MSDVPRHVAVDKKRRITDQIVEYARHAVPPATNLDASAERFATWVFTTIARGLMEPEEIAFFLETAFAQYGSCVAAFAREAGRLEERQTNPALKAFGACVASAVRRDLAAARGTARDVFEALTERGDNAHFAFYEAIEAIGGEPRK